MTAVRYCEDHLIAVCCTGGDHVVTDAGMLVDDELKTAWHVVPATTLFAAQEGDATKTQVQSVKTNTAAFEHTPGVR